MLFDYGSICAEGGGTQELWNNARTMAYVNNGIAPNSAEFKGCDCDTLGDLLNEGQPYETPGLGPIAPWYDKDDCDSIKFAGLMMLDITGIDDSFVDRELIQGFNEGGSFGPLRRRPKQFTFRALVIGSDHCGANFGLNWFRRQLHTLPDSCEFTDLNMFECCPCIEESCDHSETDVSECIDKYSRTFKKVALLSGPNVTNRYGSTCGCGCGGCSLMEIEWTMGVGSPFKFHEPRKIINGVVASGFPVQCVEWYVPDEDEDCSCFSPSCKTCGISNVIAPPRAPQVSTGNDTCTQPVVYAEECFSVGSEDIPDTGEAVLQVTIENLSEEPLYGTSVVVIPNGNESPCDELDECDACSAITVDCVPPLSTYTVDGTTRKASVETEGALSACPAPVGTNCFPVLDPCSDYCICVRFAGTPPRNVKITVAVIARE